MRSIYRRFGITDEVLNYAAPVLDRLSERFRQIDETAEYNQLRIIKAMQDAPKLYEQAAERLFRAIRIGMKLK